MYKGKGVIQLTGVIQAFDYKHNGRIYPKKAYSKILRSFTRKVKIKNILNDRESETSKFTK